MHRASGPSFVCVCQFELLERVAAAAADPVVVVLMTATPLDLTRLLAHPRVGAILHAGFPSAQARTQQHRTQQNQT